MPAKTTDKWQLETLQSQGESVITPITCTPFRIGRGEDCGLRLHNENVSRLHAEIFVTEIGLSIRDCGSTNGTFVNFHRINSACSLNLGDIVHIGSIAFHVTKAESEVEVIEPERTFIQNPYLDRLDSLISNKRVIPHFQPIIRLKNPAIVGYELLGRIACEDLPHNIPELFSIAKQWGRDVELSVLFRNAGISRALESKVGGMFFFNTVPNEMNINRLPISLGLLRNMAPNLNLAMEIHETAITDIKTINNIKSFLKDLNIKLVYDDFGAGQSRLLELMDAKPDVLKFDISLVSNIHKRSDTALKMIAALVNMAKDLGVLVLAEGIELQEEADICTSIGFDLAQGYFFGKPAPNFIHT